MRPLLAYSGNKSRATPGILIALGLLLSACSTAVPPFPVTPTPQEIGTSRPPTLTPFQPFTLTPASGETVESAAPEAGETEAPTPTAFSAAGSPTQPQSLETGETPGQDPPTSLWVAPYLPEKFRDSVSLPVGVEQVETQEQAMVRLEVGDSNLVSRWVYALVAPFPTIVDGVSTQDLRQSWKGDPAGPFAGEPLLVEESTYQILADWWGEPADGAARLVPAGELLGEAWSRRHSWAIVPFESLAPEWKVLQVDGLSPLWKEVDLSDYALTVPISLVGEPGFVSGLSDPGGGSTLGISSTNRDPAKLSTLAMTGVTALVRATAFTMHRNGVTYPAQDIGDLLRSADITHVSNEIPFSSECPAPNPTQADLRFCSDPDYIQLLEEVGTDIVELTGDHFGDWGPEAMRYTLGLYDEKGWAYYGGGYDRGDARQAHLVEHNGNRLAFIGCNAKGGGYATASESEPGAVACDFDWMHAEIARLAAEGYQVIATFQHFEYYTYTPQPDQIADFQGMAEAGAAIVSGSQSHQPQGMAFDDGAFIHYGLGNLFFDQYNFCTDNACNDGFVDRHVFFDGRYISTELIPIVFLDYARPRPMNAEEKAVLLEKVFSASGW